MEANGSRHLNKGFWIVLIGAEQAKLVFCLLCLVAGDLLVAQKPSYTDVKPSLESLFRRAGTLEAEWLAPRFYDSGRKEYALWQYYVQSGKHDLAQRAEKRGRSHLEEAIRRSESTRLLMLKAAQMRHWANGFEEIEVLYPELLAIAERSFQDAAKNIQARLLKPAIARSAKATEAFQDIGLRYLKEHQIKVGYKFLEEKQDSIAEARYKEALANFRHLEQNLSDNPGPDEMITLASQIEQKIAQIVLMNNPYAECSGPVPVTFYGPPQISAQNPDQMIIRGELRYIADHAVDVRARIPHCIRFAGGEAYRHPMVSEIKNGPIDSSSIGDVDGIVENPYYYTIEELVQEAADTDRILIRLHFPDFDDGRPIRFVLHFESVVPGIAGPLKGDFPFSVIPVAEVNSLAKVGFSESELRNGFITGLYEAFGDDGRKLIKEIDIEGQSICAFFLKNPDYENAVFDIQEDGIFFRIKATVETNCYCDLPLAINGKFQIERSGEQLRVKWVQGPTAGLDFSFWCFFSDLLSALLSIRSKIENVMAESMASQLQEIVDTLVVQNGFPVGLFNSAVFSEHGMTLAFAASGGAIENIVVKVPYSRAWFDFPKEMGIPLNRSEPFILYAAGFPAIYPTEHGVGSREVGPSGLFNWNGQVPIPDPWVFANQTYSTNMQRLHARRALRGARRELAKLVFPDAHVGALVGHLEGPAITIDPNTYFFMGSPCKVETSSMGLSHLILGPNDYFFPNMGNGYWEATLVFPGSLQVDAEPCRKRASSLIEVMQQLEMRTKQ